MVRLLAYHIATMRPDYEDPLFDIGLWNCDCGISSVFTAATIIYDIQSDPSPLIRAHYGMLSVGEMMDTS